MAKVLSTGRGKAVRSDKFKKKLGDENLGEVVRSVKVRDARGKFVSIQITKGREKFYVKSKKAASTNSKQSKGLRFKKASAAST